LTTAQRSVPFEPSPFEPSEPRARRRRSVNASQSPSQRPRQSPPDGRQEVLCSVIGLSVKLGVALLAALSLTQLGAAYQQRLDRHGELSAILDIETARLRRAQDRFDKLFSKEGEQKLLREQEQWIAPNRLRVVWEAPRQSSSLHSQL